MKVTVYINESNYLLARHELVWMEEDAKSKRTLVEAAENARETTTYIYSQLTDRQQVCLAKAAIKKRFNKLKYNEQ